MAGYSHLVCWSYLLLATAVPSVGRSSASTSDQCYLLSEDHLGTRLRCEVADLRDLDLHEHRRRQQRLLRAGVRELEVFPF